MQARRQCRLLGFLERPTDLLFDLSRAVLEQVLEFLGIELDEVVLAVHALPDGVHGAAAGQRELGVRLLPVQLQRLLVLAQRVQLVAAAT